MSSLEESFEIKLRGILMELGYLRDRGDLQMTDEEFDKMLMQEVLKLL